MRDKKRIPKILKKLQQAWLKVPDWRLGQLISNLRGTGPQDVFYVEDDEWQRLIKEFINNY